MTTLNTIEAEFAFTAGTERRREADPRLLHASGRTRSCGARSTKPVPEITELREQVDKLCAPPSTYGVYLAAHADGAADVLAQGRKVKVTLHPAIEAASLRPGQELVLKRRSMSWPLPATRSRATWSCSRSDSMMSAPS